MMFLFDLPKIEELKARKDVKGLIEALEYEPINVRKAAAEALGEIGDKCAVKPLIDLLKKKEVWWVRSAAAKALGEIVGKHAAELLTDSTLTEAVEALIDTLKNEGEDPSLRAVAAEVLGNIGDKRAILPLLEALRYEQIRVAADKALDEIFRKICEKTQGK